MNTGVRLHVCHQQSWLLSILTRFMDYYSPFWGPKAISMVVEPQSALTCRSSTLTVLADSAPFRGILLTVLGPGVSFPQLANPGMCLLVDSDPFHGLLLTILGSQSDFHGCRTPRCAYVLVINTRSFGRFWPVSWTITHRFGVPKRFP